MFLRLRDGCRLPARLDSRVGGADNGHKVSCTYFVGQTSPTSTTTAGRTIDIQDSSDSKNNSILNSINSVSETNWEKRKGPTDDTRTTTTEKSEGGVDIGVGIGGGQLKLDNMETAPIPGGIGDENLCLNRKDGKGSVPGGSGTTKQEVMKNDSANDSHVGMLAPAEGVASVGGGVVVAPTADRLVLFRSDLVCNQTLEVHGKGRAQYALMFWMHAAKETATQRDT